VLVVKALKLLHVFLHECTVTEQGFRHPVSGRRHELLLFGYIRGAFHRKRATDARASVLQMFKSTFILFTFDFIVFVFVQALWLRWIPRNHVCNHST
jgi:hypothetical protein